jgi:uncharacterized protein (TIGR02996 family)
MNRTEKALLAAVVADPHDDLVRLAYADWCEERGDYARAEFVRVQLELARLGDPDPPACGGYCCEVSADGLALHRDCRPFRLRCRAADLLDPHVSLWAPAPFAGRPHAFGTSGEVKFIVGTAVACSLLFRRGFVGEVTLPCALWLDHGPALCRAAPLERVTLAGKAPWRPTWAHGEQDHWWWVLGCRSNANRPEALPRPLFRALARLRREERRTGTGLGFADRDLALLDLSEASLCWAGAAAVAAPPAAGV